MRFLIAAIPSLLAIYFFFKYQTYYADFLGNWVFILFFLLFVGLSTLASAKFFKKKEISFLWIFVFAFLLSIIFSTYKFIEYDYSKLEGFSIIKQNNTVILHEGEIPENSEILYEEGELISNTSKVLEYLPEQTHEAFKKINPSAIFVVAGKILLMYPALALLVIIFGGIGVFFTKKIHAALAIGMLFYSLLAFFLSQTGFFTKEIVLGTVVALTLFSIPKSKKLLPELLQLKVNKWLIGITASLLALLLIDSLKTIPLGWDDLNAYARNAKVLADLSISPHAIGSFAWTNLASINWLFTDTFYGYALLSLLAQIFAFATLQKILGRFQNCKTSWLLSLLFFTLPFVVYQQVLDLKTDLPMFFAGLIGIDLLLDYFKSKKPKDLILATAILSFAFVIKITAIFLLIPIFILLLFTNKKAPFIFAGVSLLIFLPWGIYNYYDTGVFSVSHILFGGNNNATQLVEEGDYCDIRNASGDIDYTRFVDNEKSLQSFAAFPIEVTYTRKIDSPHVDFSFIFLALLPFIILFPEKTFLKNKELKVIGALTLFYFLIWYTLGKGVIWYGIFLFIPLLIFILELYKGNFSKPGKIYLYSILGLALICNLLLRIDYFAPPQQFANAIGALNKNETTDYIFPGYRDVVEIIQKEENPLVYRVGTFITYFSEIEEDSFSNDHLLERWKCIQDADIEIMKNQFISKGFTHILMHENVDKSTADQSYKEAHSKLKEFIKNSGWEVLYNEHGLILVKVPIYEEN